MPFYYNAQYRRIYGEDMITPVGRIAWPALVTAKPPPPPKDGMKAGEPRFEITWLGEADTEQTKVFLNNLQDMVNKMLLEFNKNGAKGDPKIAINSYLKDSSEVDLEKYPFFENKVFFVARNSFKDDPKKGFQVKNKNKEVIDASQIVGGQKARLVVQPHIGPTGLSFKLHAVYLIEDDKVRFGGAVVNHDTMLDAVEPSAKYCETDAQEETQSYSTAADELLTDKVVVTAEPPKPSVSVSANNLAENIKAKIAAKVQAASPGLTTGKGKQAALDNL